jgi:hypothetical protein
MQRRHHRERGDRRRHSERARFDPGRRPRESDLGAKREGAGWAPTVQIMLNFEIIVDDEATLRAIRRVRFTHRDADGNHGDATRRSGAL